MSDNKARRVMVDAFVMDGYDDYGNWAEDPSGTHMLVPVEVWEAAMGSKALSYKYFEEVHRQDDEIERLRAELDAAKWWADKHDICWNDLIGGGDE